MVLGITKYIPNFPEPTYKSIVYHFKWTTDNIYHIQWKPHQCYNWNCQIYFKELNSLIFTQICTISIALLSFLMSKFLSGTNFPFCLEFSFIWICPYVTLIPKKYFAGYGQVFSFSSLRVFCLPLLALPWFLMRNPHSCHFFLGAFNVCFLAFSF